MSDPSPVQIAPEILAVLGDHASDLVSRTVLEGPVTCVTCGLEQLLSPQAPMNVIVAIDPNAAGENLFIIRYSHPACAPSQVVTAVGALRSVDESGVDARAQFGSMDGIGVLVWETISQAHGIPAGSPDPMNMQVAGLLALGLPLATQWEPRLLTEAPDWEVRVTRGQLLVRHGRDPAAYVQDVTPDVAEWLMLAGDRCIVLTGTGTGVLAAGASEASLTLAARDGRLAGGWVPVRRGRDH